jgi:cystathionine gamma-synthase
MSYACGMSSNHNWDSLHNETKVVAAGRPDKKPDGALNPPISLNSTFHEGGPIGYGRFGNESWSALEEAISALEGGQTLIYSSGMAAISCVFSLTSTWRSNCCITSWLSRNHYYAKADA